MRACVRQLKKFPEIKKFVKDPGNADAYEGLSVKVSGSSPAPASLVHTRRRLRCLGSQYIPGHNPDLVLYGEGDVEVERVDLTAYKTLDDIKELVSAKGFKAKEEL